MNTASRRQRASDRIVASPVQPIRLQRATKVRVEAPKPDQAETMKAIPDQGAGLRLAPAKTVNVAVQQKYSIDANRSAWDRFLFWYVFLPFNRYFFDRFRFQVPDAKDANGQLSALEVQGVYPEEWKAQQEADKHRFGAVLKEIPFGESLSAESFQPAQVHPHSTSKIYDHVGQNAATERLLAKIRSTDQVVQANPL